MSFAPVLPGGGLLGWQYLSRTLERQQAAFDRNPAELRLKQAFREQLPGITTPEALVANRPVLEVALGAFGLDADLPNRGFIRKVLEDGVADPRALANRLSDGRYKAFAAAFEFGPDGLVGATQPDFAPRIQALFSQRRFEASVGNQRPELRLALALDRDLAEIAQAPGTDRAKWFRVLGSPPLREVFQTVFGLPDSFAALDIDRQVEDLQNRASRRFGVSSVSALADESQLETLRRAYLVRSSAEALGPVTGSGSVALTLLRSMAAG